MKVNPLRSGHTIIVSAVRRTPVLGPSPGSDERSQCITLEPGKWLSSAGSGMSLAHPPHSTSVMPGPTVSRLLQKRTSSSGLISARRWYHSLSVSQMYSGTPRARAQTSDVE